jgi:hypothetical protein
VEGYIAGQSLNKKAAVGCGRDKYNGFQEFAV